MDPDIDQINICISKHYCNIIHNNLVGKTQQDRMGKPNQHLYYIDLVKTYIETQLKDPKMLFSNLGIILKSHNTITRDIISLDILINTFVANYTFVKVFDKLDYSKKVSIINHIIYRSLISYLEWLCVKDNKAFFNIELTPEQTSKLSNKMFKLLRENGAIEKFKMYNTDNETVPKKLFLELKKQYDKLKKQFDELSE